MMIDLLRTIAGSLKAADVKDLAAQTADIRSKVNMVTKKDILEALGVESHEDRFMTGLLVGAGVGLLVGTVGALLLAPRSGDELRRQISDKGRDLINRRGGDVGMGTDVSGNITT